jgi:membrane protein implicated in regulation of membrane protease activity
MDSLLERALTRSSATAGAADFMIIDEKPAGGENHQDGPPPALHGHEERSMPSFLLSESAIWYWFLAGIVILLVELAIPELMPMGLSVACFAFGALYYFLPDIYFSLEIGHFLITAAVMILISYLLVSPLLYRNRRMSKVTWMGDTRGESVVGAVGRASQPFLDGWGRADINGTSWRCRGPEMPEGAAVKVTAISGNLLTVERHCP